MEGYTLANYFEEAAVEPIPEWFKDIPILNPQTGQPMKPRWTQVTGLNLCFQFDNNRAGIYDDMGTGKTLIAQAFSIWHAAMGNKIVALMPPVLMRQFQRSLERTFPGLDKYVEAAIYHGPKRKKTAKDWEKGTCPDIMITTYDTFRSDIDWIVTLGYEGLMMDEARVLTNTDNKTVVSIREFMGKNGEKTALAMTGTVAKNNLSNLYGFIAFVTPHVYRSRLHFEHLHVDFVERQITYEKKGEQQEMYVQVPDTYRDVITLYNNLFIQARRVEKRDAIPDLQPVNIQTIEYELDEAHKEKYNELVENRLIIFDDNTILDATTSARLRNAAFYAVLRTDTLKLKTISTHWLEIEELLEELDVSNNKVFMMAHYQATVEFAAEYFKKYNPAVIYGKTNNADAEKQRFIEDESCRIVIINYASGGVGIDGFQHVCCNGIVVEPTGVPGDFEQAIGRLDRSGQDKAVTIYVPTPLGTIFPKTVASMTKKQKQISAVVSRASLHAELMGVDTV